MGTNENGFTLIELLVAVGIVTVLTAVALPQYQEYRENGYDRQAQSALRSTALSEEAYFLVNDEYATCDESTCEEVLENVPAIPAGVVMQVTSHGKAFDGESYHRSGSGITYYWNK